LPKRFEERALYLQKKVTEEEALHILGFRGKGSWEAGQPVCPRSVGKIIIFHFNTEYLSTTLRASTLNYIIFRNIEKSAN